MVTIQASTKRPTYNLSRPRGEPLRSRRFLQNKRGIDTIVASLLMVTIVVIASVMVFTYATGLFQALLIAPKTATENVSLEYPNFISNSQVNLFVRNIGTTPITLTAYYVRDYSGNQYALTSWSSAPPAFSPRSVANTTVLISSSCIGCARTGSAFNFQSGQAYTILLVTKTNSVFSFQIAR
jgi:hypothetical protein